MNLDTILRDQLVRSLWKHDTRMDLFRENNLTFEKAYKIATDRETASKNAATTGNKTSSDNEIKALAIPDDNKSLGRSRSLAHNRGKGRQRRNKSRSKSNFHQKSTSTFNSISNVFLWRKEPLGKNFFGPGPAIAVDKNEPFENSVSNLKSSIAATASSEVSTERWAPGT